jgi:hypothetical protein
MLWCRSNHYFGNLQDRVAMMSDYEIAAMILKRPRMCFAETRTFRDVLALLHGVAVGRYPPHGSGFLDGFNNFVNARFKAPPVAEYHTLLKHFGDRPLSEACKAVLDLLQEWKQSSNEG